MEPAALDLSLKAIEDVQRERQRLNRHWEQRLERASYEVQRAERQYQAVEPENRLVARGLEQQWEKTLRAQRDLREEYDRFLKEQPPRLTEQERSRILAVAADIPTLWHVPRRPREIARRSYGFSRSGLWSMFALTPNVPKLRFNGEAARLRVRRSSGRFPGTSLWAITIG